MIDEGIGGLRSNFPKGVPNCEEVGILDGSNRFCFIGVSGVSLWLSLLFLKTPVEWNTDKFGFGSIGVSNWTDFARFRACLVGFKGTLNSVDSLLKFAAKSSAVSIVENIFVRRRIFVRGSIFMTR